MQAPHPAATVDDMRTLTLIALFSVAVAQADILHLHNGRTLEGQIVRRTPTHITLRMNFGRMTVRSDQVREIERRLRPEHELAERYRQIDPTNPAQLERLSLWASRRGLGREAGDLLEHARGIRLEQKLEAIRDSKRVEDWLNVYAWARVNEVSDTVQVHLLETARGIDPDDRGVQAMFAAREEEARAAARRQAEIERRRDEPIFKMPDERDRFVRSSFIPVVDQIRDDEPSGRVARVGAVRPAGPRTQNERLQRIADASGLRPQAPEADEDAEARIRELEQRLEAQEQRTAEQDERVAEQEAELKFLRNRRRSVRRNRNPNAAQLIRARPLPQQPAAPPAKPPLTVGR